MTAVTRSSWKKVCAEEQGLSAECIVPRMDQWEIFPRVAVATAMRAQEQGVTALSKTREELHAEATAVISQARRATEVLVQERIIAPSP